MALRERAQASDSNAKEVDEKEINAAWLERLVGPSLIRSKGDGFEHIPTGYCRGKHVLINFTPLLVEFYSQAKKNGDLNLEVVFVGLDRDEQSHKEYFSKMPWLACPDLSKCKQLAGSLSVMSVPSLIVFSPEGSIITRGGVRSVMQDPKGAGFPWEGSGDSMALNFMQKVFIAVLVLVLLRAVASHFM